MFEFLKGEAGKGEEEPTCKFRTHLGDRLLPGASHPVISLQAVVRSLLMWRTGLESDLWRSNLNYVA